MLFPHLLINFNTVEVFHDGKRLSLNPMESLDKQQIEKLVSEEGFPEKILKETKDAIVDKTEPPIESPE